MLTSTKHTKISDYFIVDSAVGRKGHGVVSPCQVLDVPVHVYAAAMSVPGLGLEASKCGNIRISAMEAAWVAGA